MQKIIHRVREFLFILVEWLEMAIAVLLLLGVIAHLTGFSAFWGLFPAEDLTGFLLFMFNALIGIELIELLCRNNMTYVTEVLMIAVVRYLLLHHESALDLLLGVLAVVALFAVRKFLLVHPPKDEPV